MDRSPLLEHHQEHGARLAERPEAPGWLAPLFFGEVPEEYRSARTGAALLDSSDRGRVTVEGPDAADFLHRLLANHVKSLSVGAGNANLLLSPKGKVLFTFDLTRSEQQAFQLSTPPGRAPVLAGALEGYRFSEKLRIEDTSAKHAPLELFGPRAEAVLRGVFGPLTLPGPMSASAVVWSQGPVELSCLANAVWRIDAGSANSVALWKAMLGAGATPIGLVVRDSLRVEAGRALDGVDIDDGVYPQEAGLEPAFALDKGCYVGQEVVAKIDTYGGLNKRLLPLRVEHSDPIARGTKLMRTEEGASRELGLVTSWAYSFALDTGLVLAYVKRRHQEPGTVFELADGQGQATIVPLPGP